MSSDEWPSRPTWPFRFASTFELGVVGFLAHSFIFGLNNVELKGFDNFCNLLDQRKDVQNRERGLITVSNHLSVMDDPLMWGVLPYRYHWNQDNMRWSLGSYDVCFKNYFTSIFFALGQVLPTHRSAHSSFGGLFQPSVTQAVRLLSRGPFINDRSSSRGTEQDVSDPFSSANLSYSTNGFDSFPSPTAYYSRRHAWVHIFPEGRIHQHKQKAIRYFKWGVGRLILESEPCPDVVPIWIEGFDDIMHESRQFPRFIPRAGKDVFVHFGDKLEVDKVFGDLRHRWRRLLEVEQKKLPEKDRKIGVLTDTLKYGREARDLRIECTNRVRQHILKLRHERGFPMEDPKNSRVETWRKEGFMNEEGKMADESWVRDG